MTCFKTHKSFDPSSSACFAHQKKCQDLAPQVAEHTTTKKTCFFDKVKLNLRLGLQTNIPDLIFSETLSLQFMEALCSK